MNTFKIIFSTFSMLIILTHHSFGQGCSDAGFCTLNSFKPNSDDSIKAKKNQFKIGAFYGSADNSISVYGSYLEYNRQINKKFGLDLKLTNIAQQSNSISTFGFSDVFINTNYNASKKIKITIGTKIPLSNANKSIDNLPIPMDFQASLGTFDLIFGMGYEIKKIQFVAAIQQPLTQNSNEFISSNYPVNSNVRNFQTTNKFKRSGDVLLRVSYPISLYSKLKLTPSILPIYHLMNDTYSDGFNIERNIVGSKGLTLNANFYIDYEINHRNILQLNVGMPFITRASRPDGLTRHLIANVEYRIKF